jgi:blue copper oxidase
MPFLIPASAHGFRASVLLRGLAGAAVISAASVGLCDPPDVEIELHVEPWSVQIQPGAETEVLRFNGGLIHGPTTALQSIPGSYLGPVMRFRKDDRVAITVVNALNEETVAHWHGLNVPDVVDGHPRFALHPGESRRLTFDIINRAGTYWYHPHPHMRTGPQVYAGLAGLLIVEDDEEQALPLPRGEYDVPLVIQDRIIDAGSQFVYAPTAMQGLLGDRILVNGHLNYVHSCATRIYRLRLLNGSNARIYKLGWDDGSPMTVIGNDGGLLAAPVVKPYITLAPGERVEVWADFSARTVGSQVVLRSLSFTGASAGGVPPMPQGAVFDVMTFSIDRSRTETLTLPAQLTAIEPHLPQNAVNWNDPRTFAISFAAGEFRFNNRTFEMLGVAPDEIVKAGDLEAWVFTNTSGMMLMAHPIHLHGAHFQIHSRTVTAAQQANWETVRHGYIDEGWKDTFLMMPGETVRILVKHGPYPGLYLYHCHNLEHEDMGMMRNFRIDP